MKLLSQNHVKYALIMSGIIALCLVFMEVTGQNDSFDKSPLVAAAMFFAPVVIWYLGINAKKKLLKGNMTFKQGLLEGFKISLVYGIVSPFLFLVYYLLVNPGILEYVRKVYALTGASDTNVIVVDMAIQFFSAIIMGTLLGAVASFFLKSKNKSKSKKKKR
jgi:hypothetical protein